MSQVRAARPRILQVSTTDVGGGAERVAHNLHRAYRRRGLDAWLAVGERKLADERILRIPHLEERGSWYRFWWAVRERAGWLDERLRQGWRFRYLLAGLADPLALVQERRGLERFRHPGTWRLPELTPEPPEIIHAHNLHGDYFDLRALPWLANRTALVLTLHDAWLLSGHCAHSLECQRWLTGCGRCPDLALPPAVRRDATAQNWRRKAAIYRATRRLHVAAPCRWLLERVSRSMLAPAVADTRVIPYGIDLQTFRPGSRAAARQRIGVGADEVVVLFAANGITANPWKDYRMLREAVGRLAEDLRDHSVVCLALGQDAPAERIGAAEVRFIPFQKDATAVAEYYRAADVYLHAARVDTFPNTVLEALACGTPVVATAVGGIPEQVRDGGAGGTETGGPTGALVPAGDAGAMAAAAAGLVRDPARRDMLARNAAADARARFDLEREADAYLAWYAEILENAPSTEPSPC